LSSVFRKVQSEDIAGHSRAVVNVIDIHADTLIAVAFARPYRESQWNDARASARALISTVLLADIADIGNAIDQLCKSLDGGIVALVPPSIRQVLWKKAYENIQITDLDGMSMMLGIVARTAHLDALATQPFRTAGQKPGQLGSATPEATCHAVNLSLTAMRSGFLDMVSKFASYNESSRMLEFMRKEGVVKDLMVLMLSPVEDAHVAAQTLVGQAFDVDVRLDCFRALLERFPQATFDGMLNFLETFTRYAPVVPEACSLSKSLVRCLTDVIEVLCASHDGLLNSDHNFTSKTAPIPMSVLPTWWALMTKAIAVIFKRTPSWSIYFENEDMIVWMRDALIFGRELLAQRGVIESAVSLGPNEQPALQQGKAKRLTPAGKRMIDDLQVVLPELARWLRLTDEELLHQSFSLLQSLLDCFRESAIPPSKAGIAKLTKHIDDARTKDPKRPQTRLDSKRLLALEDSLASFIEDDDDVQIIPPSVFRARPAIVETKSKVSPPKAASKDQQLPKEAETQQLSTKLAKTTIASSKEQVNIVTAALRKRLATDMPTPPQAGSHCCAPQRSHKKRRLERSSRRWRLLIQFRILR
jgi:senataxin